MNWERFYPPPQVSTEVVSREQIPDSPSGPPTEIEAVEIRYRRVGRPMSYRLISLAGFGGLESWFRSQAIQRLHLKEGDSVLDVACGRGGNFPYLERAVGEEGRIVGMDYSRTMLAGAEELLRERGWSNVELTRMDAAEMPFEGEFDGAICTVAMAVIPRWRHALRRMVAATRAGRRIAILDGRLGRGIYRAWNPYVRLFASLVGAHLDRDIPLECNRLLPDAREESLGPYYFVVSGSRTHTSPTM